MHRLLEVITQGEHFKLTKLPMPPSSNHQYWNQIMPGRGGGGQVARPTPTGDLKKFQKAVTETWKNANLVAAVKCRALMKDWVLSNRHIRNDVLCCWNYFDIFTQMGVPKRVDASNRIKALHDVMAEIMEVDDSWFWSSGIHKVEIKGTEPWCVVIFSPVHHVSLQDLKDKGVL